MEEKEIEFLFKARYYKSGPVTAETRQIWIALHGYGQLARFFSKKFTALESKQIVVITPEGLSRFYLSELTATGRKDNKVGATWMTSENRLMDIENYLTFLNRIYDTEVKPFQDIPVTLFGFSQGCATVCRWATEGKVNFERLILWAGLFPPDMDFSKGHDILINKKTYLVAGDQDHFLTPERMAEFDDLAGKLNIQPEKIMFSGKHEIEEETLRKLGE